jgi:hypothetical protein
VEKAGQDTLRIRCEGKLEVLEQSARRYGALVQALQDGDWELFSGFNFREVASRCAEAQREVERHRADDSRGAGRSAVAALARARALAHRQLARRAKQISVAFDEELEVLAARVRSQLPIRLETQIRVLAPPRVSGALFQGLCLTLTAGVGLGLLVVSSVTILLLVSLGEVPLRLPLGLALGGASLGLLRGFTSADSRLAVAFRALLSRRVRLVLTRSHLSVGARHWRLEAISKALVDQGRQPRLTIRSPSGSDVEVLGENVEGLLAALEKQDIPLEVRSSPAESIEALRHAAVRNQRGERGR